MRERVYVPFPFLGIFSGSVVVTAELSFTIDDAGTTPVEMVVDAQITLIQALSAKVGSL